MKHSTQLMKNQKNKKQASKIRYRSWGDLKKDKQQKHIYTENMSFVASTYMDYADKKQ